VYTREKKGQSHWDYPVTLVQLSTLPTDVLACGLKHPEYTTNVCKRESAVGMKKTFSV